jgi:hypothetical protein
MKRRQPAQQFCEHLQRIFNKLFQPIESKDQSVKQLIECGRRTVTIEMRATLTQPISMEELWQAVSQGKLHKTPEIDGICLEFYRAEWDVIKTELLQILNCMFTNGPLLARQVQGQVVCIPKKPQPVEIGDYRPLTLLNADYKLLVRIISNRLKPLLQEIMHPQQYCGIPGTTVFDAVTTIRDTIAYAESKKVLLCVVSLDLHSAFHKILHNYLQDVLRAHGFGNLFVDRIMGLYRNAASEVQVNGFRSTPIPVRNSIRQGCPLTMQLYTLCLNPLLHILEEKFAGDQRLSR